MAHESDNAEAVAYALLERVAYVEKKDIGVGDNGLGTWERPSRAWILSTYADCLRTVTARPQERRTVSADAREGYAGYREVSREAILASDPI